VRLSQLRQHRLFGLNIAELALLLLALSSLTYAVITAPRGGFDLQTFQGTAQRWIDGSYTFGRGPAHMYPPFAVPLFAVLAFIPFNILIVIWLALNIAAAAVTLQFAIKLYGADWEPRLSVWLTAILLVWAPFRVTLRLGQISLMVTGLLLGTLSARQKKRDLLAGLLLGLSLCKFSLTLPFLLYFIFKREWRLVAVSLAIPVVLAELFALRMGISIVDAFRAYSAVMAERQVQGYSGWTGTTEVKMLLLSLTGGNETLTLAMTAALILTALIAMSIVFKRTPNSEGTHFAVLALFGLWSAYHRVYDSVICIIPAALFIDSIEHKRMERFSRFWLGALGLLAISVPGLLTERFQLNAEELASNPLGWLGLHIERLLVFGMFWALLFKMREAGE
jgi:hypothetical protein